MLLTSLSICETKTPPRPPSIPLPAAMPSRRRRRSKPKFDRVSALPDSLICHILSFLPTKLAVATSILSKRWRPLWRSVLTLDFEEECFEDFNRFRYFVYSVIFSQNPTLPLRSFSIRCGQSINFDPHDLERFIHAAVQRRVEIIDLDLCEQRSLLYDPNELIPSVLRVFSCRTLVVLKLANLVVSHVPNLVDFPLLKTLHLELVAFETPSAHFMNLIRGCSLIEDLHMDDVYVSELCTGWEREFEGFPNLVIADIHYIGDSFPFVWLYNAKLIFAHLVISMNYRPIRTFHNLTHMEFYFEYDGELSWPGKWELVTEVLYHCPKLQSLIIVEDSSYTGDVQAIDDWKDPEIVPECLSSQLRTCCLRNFKAYQCQLQFAEYIMLNSKLLCTMTIKSSHGLDGNAKKELLEKLSSYPRGSPTCKLLFDS